MIKYPFPAQPSTPTKARLQELANSPEFTAHIVAVATAGGGIVNLCMTQGGTDIPIESYRLFWAEVEALLPEGWFLSNSGFRDAGSTRLLHFGEVPLTF